MVMIVVTLALVAFVAFSALLAVAVGRAAHLGEVAHADQAFLRGVALESSQHATLRQLAGARS